MATNHTLEPQLCVMYESKASSTGILNGQNPLDYFVPLAMFQLVLFFTTSWTLYFLLRPLKQPKFVCNVLAGVLLGPSVLGKYTSLMDKLFPAKEMLTINTLGAFSNIVFIFLTAVKMDTRTILSTARDAWSLGLLSSIPPVGISFLLFMSLKGFLRGMMGGVAGLTSCALISTSFLADVANGLEELKLLTSELGQLVTSAATINEAILLIIVAILLMSSSMKSSYGVDALLLLVAFIIFTIFVARPIISWIIRTTPEGKPVHQFSVVSILVGTLCMGLFSDILGLGFLPGTMAMGLIIPNGPPLGAAIVEKTEVFVNQFFMPFYYLRIGHYLDTDHIQDWDECYALLLIIVSAFLLKFLATCLHSLFYKMRVRDVLLVSLMLNIKGVYNFIYLVRFYWKKRIDGQSFALLALSGVAMNAIAMPLVQIFYKPRLRIETSLSQNLYTMSLQSTPTVGELRILSCIHNEDEVHGIISLLEACNPKPVSTICAYVVHLRELVGRATPLLAPYTKVGNSSTDRIMRAFSNYSKASDESVVVQSFTSIAPYKTIHETICRLARAKHVPLVIIPLHENQVGEINANFRCFNSQMQAYATSTVGILVQRGLRCFSSAEFSCNVVVVFVGGADDREALALAARMSDHPRVKVTVMRIIIMGASIDENGLKQHLDDQLLKEFKAKTITNDSVQCFEVILTEGIEIFSWLRSLEQKNYDLVMVGKQHDINLKLEGDMAGWTQYAELGVIGDMVASDDFCGGTVSVLVLQHCTVGKASKKWSSSDSGRSRYSFSSFSSLLKY